eukprot:SAG31_NODE_25491_length_460_cov_0.753463_1_plen_75_part_10
MNIYIGKLNLVSVLEWILLLDNHTIYLFKINLDLLHVNLVMYLDLGILKYMYHQKVHFEIQCRHIFFKNTLMYEY